MNVDNGNGGAVPRGGGQPNPTNNNQPTVPPGVGNGTPDTAPATPGNPTAIPHGSIPDGEPQAEATPTSTAPTTQPTVAEQIADLRDQGNKALAAGELDAAIKLYNDALTQANQLGDANLRFDLYMNLGIAQSRKGDTQAAINNFNQASQIAADSNDAKSQAKALGNLGNAYLKRKDIPKAIEYYQRVEDIAEHTNDEETQGANLLNLGIAHYNQGNMSEAITYLQRALPMLNKLNDERGANMASSYLDLAKSQSIPPKGPSEEDRRYNLGIIFVITFSAGLLFIGLLILTGIVRDLVYPTPRDAKPFFSFDNMIQLMTTFGTIVGTPLGFVVGYYFKGQEDKQKQDAANPPSR